MILSEKSIDLLNVYQRHLDNLSQSLHDKFRIADISNFPAEDRVFREVGSALDYLDGVTDIIKHENLLEFLERSLFYYVAYSRYEKFLADIWDCYYVN